MVLCQSSHPTTSLHADGNAPRVLCRTVPTCGCGGPISHRRPTSDDPVEAACAGLRVPTHSKRFALHEDDLQRESCEKLRAATRVLREAVVRPHAAELRDFCAVQRRCVVASRRKAILARALTDRSGATGNQGVATLQMMDLQAEMGKRLTGAIKPHRARTLQNARVTHAHAEPSPLSSSSGVRNGPPPMADDNDARAPNLHASCSNIDPQASEARTWACHGLSGPDGVNARPSQSGPT